MSKQNESLENQLKLIIIAALHVRRPYKIEYASANDWDPELFFGEPNYESDSAWESLIFRELFFSKSRSFGTDFTDLA